FTALAYWVVGPTTAGEPMTRASYLVPFLASLFVASSLTVATRSALAGAVVPPALAGVLMVAAQQVYGVGRAGEAGVARFRTLSFGMLSAASVLLGWRAFATLQSLGDRQFEFQLTLPRAHAAPFRRRSPLWLLVRKELHLQQLAFAITPIYVIAYVWIVTTF